MMAAFYAFEKCIIKTKIETLPAIDRLTEQKIVVSGHALQISAVLGPVEMCYEVLMALSYKKTKQKFIHKELAHTNNSVGNLRKQLTHTHTQTNN